MGSRSARAPIVVDAGFRLETARRRGREVVADPIDVLARLGIDAAEVREVVITHLHYDHAGHLAAFPRARFWVQDEELAFWTGRHAGRGAHRPRSSRPTSSSSCGSTSSGACASSTATRRWRPG